MKRLYFLILISLVAVASAFSQGSAPCSQVLRLVRTTYEQGRLHELPALTEGCLKAPEGKGFTKEEKRETYRWLTLAYIYLEEPEKADEMMLNLLNTDHFYEVNKTVDPAEFIALYNKFRTKPIFNFGLKFGMNVTQPIVTSNYYVSSPSSGNGKYSLAPSLNVLGVFHKAITNNITFAPEIGLVLRNYNYGNPSLAKSDSTGNLISSQNFVIKQTWIDLNAIGIYYLKPTAWNPYIGFGPGISYLLGSNNQPNTVLGNGFTVTGPTVDDSKSYNKMLYSLTVLAGVKRRIGELYLIADIRYQYGLSNAVKASSRSNSELAYDYQGQYNDYHMNNFMINVGVLIPKFSPKKLIK